MTETPIPILDESAVSEIEAILNGDDFEAKYIAASVDNLTALCRTARHLLAENAQDYYFGNNQIYEDDLPRGITKALYDQWFARSQVVDGVRMGPFIERKSASFDALRADRGSWRRVAERLESEKVALQSQLEQLRAENETLRAADYSALTSDEDDFRSRAIQLCKDKAAELNREVNTVDPEDDPTYFQVLAARIATANELATELEKL